MRWLVTGCCGFLGSHLCKYISKNTSNDIIGIDKLSYCSSLKNIEGIERFKFIQADFCDYNFMKYILESEKPDVIFHIGAYTHVDNSFNSSLKFTYNNVYGTHVILELCRELHISKLIHMSTDEVYGSVPDGEKADENSKLDPTNPYSVSKACAESIIETYISNFNLNVIRVRCNNLIGTHQFVEKLIPKFILRLLRGDKCCIHGNGKNTRNFTDVKEVCRGLVLIAEKSEKNEIWNIGVNEEYSVNDITHLLISSLIKLTLEQPVLFTSMQVKHLQQNYADLIEYVPDRIFNDTRYTMSTDKIRSKLGFEINQDIEHIIQDVCLWYVKNQNYYNGNDIIRYTQPHCKM